MIEVVLVDHHEALRKGLEDLLGRRGIRTLGTASTAAAAVDLLDTVDPDVVVLGIQLRDLSGLQLTRRLCLDHPGLAILIYTSVEDVATLAEALDCGARGFALKLGSIDQLVQGLRQVARGKRYVDPQIRALLDAAVEGKPLILTKREREIFDLLAQGMTGEEIATRLTVSPDTVRTHIRNGMKSLHAHTRTGAVVQALKAAEIEG